MPIGRTELGFPVVMPEARFGWFIPNDEGLRILPRIAAPLPAIGAMLAGEPADGGAGPTGEPDAATGSAWLADLAESAQHHRALELELRREDGSVVPTTDIAFQDAERLRELGRRIAEREGELFGCEEELLAEWEGGAMETGEDEPFPGWWDELDDDAGPPDFSADQEEVSRPEERYQIFVGLVDPASIP